MKTSDRRQNTDRLTGLAGRPPLETLPADALLLAEDVAAYTGLNVKSLANARSEARGLPYVKLQRQVRYRAGDVVAAIAAGRRGAA